MKEFINQGSNELNLRTDNLYRERQQKIFRQTDRMFGVLMTVQWIAGIMAALLISPYTWIGQDSSIHIHVWAAVILGGLISSVPVFLAWRRPGKTSTRYVIATGQMLMSSLLIHLTGGRIETHFHIFGSLAFLAFYRDWRVLIPATIVTILDHLLRGMFYPQSIFGVFSSGHWRWVEHSGWVAFENIFLVISCVRQNREMYQNARATAALEFGKKDYQFLSDFVPQHIWKINRHGQFYYVNQQAINYFGISQADDEINIKLEDIVHPEDLSKFSELWRREIRSKRRLEMPLRLRQWDGEYRWHLVQSIPKFDESGKLTEFFGTSTDIHEERLAEQAAAKSREYINLFKHANNAIIIFDINGEVVLDVNDCACETYCYSREEFIGRKLKTFSREFEHDKKQVSGLIEIGDDGSFETNHYRQDGTLLSMVVNASVIEFDGKKAILSINRDVTAQMHADNALRRSEYKLRTLIENMNEGLLETDANDIVLYANSRFCEMTGYPLEELLGQVAAETFLDQKGREIIDQANLRRFQGGVTDTYELQITKKDGQPLWALVGGVPLADADGKITGSIGVHTDITERKRTEEQFRHNSLHDALTGLPNRALLVEHLRKSLKSEKRRPNSSFAVLFLDFDRFKVVNDSLGHMEGDKLLVMIARRLELAVREEDVVARLGGDEYTVLLDNITGVEQVLAIADRIQDIFKLPFKLADSEVFMSASIGIALSDSNYTKPEEILRDADIAMYKAKANGKARYEIFNSQMHEQANYRLQLETEMRTALERNEFQLFYQPIVEIRNSRIVGFEALIRWIHPVRGIVSPLDFIPLAEENGTIIPIGDWVIYESCRQLSEWRHGKPEYEGLTISVNLSSKQFNKGDLVERVAEILLETNLPAHLLRLEITETHLMEDSLKATQIINGLRQLGVKTSIDDFGTGYSSLSYLHQLPVNFLKIDRSFVGRMRDSREKSEIVRTILMLAENLGFKVIAEGVETNEQAHELEALNCDFAQGYLYSKPVNKAEATALLRQQNQLAQAFAPMNVDSDHLLI